MAAIIMMVATVALWGETKEDVLTNDNVGTYTKYTEWSGVTDVSGAVYKGMTSGEDSIMIRETSNNTGVVTTTSGGYVQKVRVVWNSSTNNGRILNVYGKTSAYSKATDLFGSSKGTLLGTIVKGTSTELTIIGRYTHVGICASGGTAYLDGIAITWSDGNETVPIDLTGATGTGTDADPYQVTVSGPVPYYYNGSITFIAPEGHAITKVNKTTDRWTGVQPYAKMTNTTAFESLTDITVSCIALDNKGTVTVSSAGTGTFCPAENVIVGDGTKTQIVTGVSGDVLVEETLHAVPAGTGVLIHGAGTYTLYGGHGLEAAEPTTNYLVGVLADETATPGTYVLQNHSGVVAFYHVESTTPMVKAGRAYLNLSPLMLAPKRGFFFNDEDAQTTFADAPSLGTTERVGQWYTLSGMPVSTPQRGVSILRRPDGSRVKRYTK